MVVTAWFLGFELRTFEDYYSGMRAFIRTEHEDWLKRLLEYMLRIRKVTAKA